MNWPEAKLVDLQNKVEAFSKNFIKYFCFVHSLQLSGENKEEYIFNPEYFENISNLCSNEWTQLYLSDSLDKPCIYIITAHGSDVSDSIWELRSKANIGSIFCLWHFDNHMAYFGNYKSAISADLNFLSHNLKVEPYLLNPISPLAGHIPACTAQFGPTELEVFHSTFLTHSRISKALFNYVIYDSAPRSQLIHNLSHQLSDIADFKLMPAADRTRYWDFTRADRYLEWASYKCSVIIPIVNDLSTRVFDCLATGVIPIVPNSIEDLDLVITRDEQISLGIVRIKDYNDTTIRDGINLAINIFDSKGTEGVIMRIQYVLNNATIGHRVKSLIDIIDDISNSKKLLRFGRGPNGIGAYIVNS